MPTLIFIAIAGFAAQLVDGGIGMGFGVTSTTLLLFLAGLGPAQASAVVHTAELGTTLVSGFSHWRFGNVDWKIVFSLAIPGAIAAFIGATLLSNLSLDAAEPITSTILFIIALNLMWRFSRGKIKRTVSNKPHSAPFLIGLGSVGGMVDATGGGGWGPVTTSTLMSVGRSQPRKIIGTVNTAEFLVAVSASAGFIVGLEAVHDSWQPVLGLLIGGVIAAPIAAWVVTKIRPDILGGLVGALLVLLNGLRVSASMGWIGVAIAATVAALCITVVLRSLGRTRRAAAVVEPAPTDADDDPDHPRVVIRTDTL